MDKIVAVVTVNVIFLVVGLLIYRGKLDDILTISFGKSPLEKRRIDYKSFRRTVLAVMILCDIFASVLVLIKM